MLVSDQILPMTRSLLDGLRNVLYAIACRTRLDTGVWVYGAWLGASYNDNSKYLFEYMSRHHPEITSVWLSRRMGVVAQIRRLGYRAYLFYSPLGLWYAFRSGVAIFCCGYSVDLPGPCMSPGKTYVQLWHGVGPKKVGMLHNASAGKKQAAGRPPYEGDLFSRYSYFFTLSPATKQKTIEMFGIPHNKHARVRVTGYPRNDGLFTPTVAAPLSQLIHLKHKRGLKVGVYMPTHRSEGKQVLLSTIMDQLRAINHLLQEHDLYLLVKLHHFHAREIGQFNLSHVHLIRDEEIVSDMYPILGLTDFLLTDYSSIYIDYLLLDKPIFFYVSDIDEYRTSQREFYFDYTKVTPGPKVHVWSDLVPVIVAELRHDTYKVARLTTKKMFHAFNDAGSSQRVAEDLIKTLSVS
jgi:CDP-glycerol glycerophosphotransferase (TagB/SpsB family)